MMNQRSYFEFTPEKLKKVKISEVRPNDWNPKDPHDPEYAKVLESVELNGLTQPIFVRENDNGGTKYEILDGFHRWRAARELGFTEIYIYNEGEVPDELAKSLTLWHEVSVKTKQDLLAPLAMELQALDIKLPYTDKEMAKFELATVEFDGLPELDLDAEIMKTLKIRCTKDQYDTIMRAIHEKMDNENVNEGRALELLVVKLVENADAE